MQAADKIRSGRLFRHSGWLLAAILATWLGGNGVAAGQEERADRLYSQWQQGLQRELLSGDVQADDGQLARWLIPRLADRRYLFVPLWSPDQEVPRPEELDRQLRSRAAELFELARAVASEAPDRSFQWLHEVVFLDPDHSEARRILGHRPLRGQWRLGPPPRAVLARRPHSELGWPAGRYWEVSSRHFRIWTNASAQAGEALADQLELLHNAWQQLFFSFWSDARQLQRQWERPGVAWIRHAPLEVVLFADRQQYLDTLRPYEPRIDVTLGYYAQQRGTAFFYAGDASLRRTWWHEVVHQLFDQYRRGSQPIRTDSLFAMVEGVAMYMESMQLYPGYVTLGGLESPRLQAARQRKLVEGDHVPFSQLLELGRDELQGNPDIRALYSQAAGLAHLLLDSGGRDDQAALERILTEIYEGKAIDRQSLASDAERWEEAYHDFLQVGDQHLQRAARVSRPQKLALGMTQVTDAALPAVGAITSLEWLDLSGTKVTDQGVAHLAGLGQLRHLGLAHTGITDRSLPILAAMERLESVTLAGTKVTDRGRAWLADQRPDLQVVVP